tara:strand:- start:907 stop:1326 length:420 start_codon:yes stop_codon:yes gene_type:complete
MIRYIVPTVLIALLILKFCVTRENSRVLVYEGEDNFSSVNSDALLARHSANFDKLKQALADKGNWGTKLRLVPTGGHGSGRCRWGRRGNSCVNRNNNCADAITWCPMGTVAAQLGGGNNPPCQCAALHTNFSGYNFKPV